MNRQIRIGVIGNGTNLISEPVVKISQEVGKIIAQNNAILVCGGLDGVMKFAAKGAKQAGGTTIGILPYESIDNANPYIDIPIATGLGEARNILVVRNSDVLVAIEGRYGTLSEIAFALKLHKTVIGLNTWELHKRSEIDKKIVKANTPEEAVKKALDIASS